MTLADLSKLLLTLRTRRLTKNVSLRVDRFVLQELDGAREVAEGDRVPLRAVDLAVLKPGKWLTGDIIGAVLVRIVARHKRLPSPQALRRLTCRACQSGRLQHSILVQAD